LEAQRVAGAEPHRLDPERPAGLDQAVPDAGAVTALEVELEAVLAGVAGARDDRRDPEQRPLHEPVGGHGEPRVGDTAPEPAGAPSTRNSPMWEMSNSPTPVRTSWCSRTSPVYRSGISKPAKSTSLAPAAAWKRWNGVRLRVVAGTRRAPGEETSGRYRMGCGRSRRGAARTSGRRS